MSRSFLVVVLLTAACGEVMETPPDAGPDALACDPDQPPDAPSIVAPVPGRIDVVIGQLDVDLTDFVDPDPGDTHGATEVEIWSTTTVPVRIWHAHLEAGAASLTHVALADGAYDLPMFPWTDYVVRARYRDDRGACAEWSAWSADVPFRTDDGSTALFDPDVIHDIYLTIPLATWEALNAEAIPPGCSAFSRNYYPAWLSYEGQSYDDIGIHIKGGCGSARDLDHKASFKIKLDWDDPAVPGCPAPRRIGGQKHLTLNAGVQDPTLEHERLGYELERALGVPTPRAASVRVWVNGAYWGVYTNVETIDRRFLERWFGSSRGMMYEGAYWCDLVPGNVPDTLDDSGCLAREFRESACDAPQPGDDPLTYDLLRDFVDRIQALPDGGFYPEVEQFFDFDTFLSQWAIEGIFTHWDAYEFDIMNNYRVYHDPSTGRWSMIPTGIDQTFHGDLDPFTVTGVLAARCVAEPDCQAAFAARLAQVNAWFAALDMQGRAQAIYDQISPDVLADPRKEVDNVTYADEVSYLVNYMPARPVRITEILAAHGY